MVITNKKHIGILASARKLFWKYGYKRVTIEEICKDAKTSKMTFYKFFPNKLELAKVVFDNEVHGGMVELRRILKEDTDIHEKMRQLLHLKAESTHEISREFLNDFYANPELGVKEYIELRTRETWQEIIGYFKEAQDRGLFRKDLKMEFLLVFTQHLSGLMSNPETLSMFKSPQEMIMEITNLLVYGIIPHNK